MSLASLFAKTIVKASDNVFDSQKVMTQIKAPVQKLNEEQPFMNNEQVEYGQKVLRSLITGESPKFSDKEKTIDPDGAIYNTIDSLLVERLPELRYSRYYKVADKDVELEEIDQAVVEYYKDIIASKKEARLLSETAIQEAAENVVKNIKSLPEYRTFVNARLPKKASSDDDPITQITNRGVAEQEFIKDSVETGFVYRAIDLGQDREYDLRFPFPSEIGTHVGGDLGQANFIATQKVFGDDARDMLLADAKFVTAPDADGFPIRKRIMPEKSFNKFFALRQAFTRMGWNPTELDLDKDTFDDIAQSLALNEVEELAMLRSATNLNQVTINKGRINIKNPLDLTDSGWTPDEFNADPELWARSVAEQTGFEIEEILEDPAFIDLRGEIRGSSQFVQDLVNGNTINFLTDSLEGLRNARLSVKVKDWMESYGFDSIRYINAFEPSVPEGTGYSYVLFRPEQFKSVSAARFDPTDPRFSAAEGGVLSFFKKFLESNQEIKQPKTRTIAKGDTLSKISKETGVSVADLVKLNNIKNPDLIRIGDTLILESEAQAQPVRREVRKPVQREEPRRAGIRAVAARRTRATPTERNNLVSRISQSISDAKNALLAEAVPINIRAFVGDLVGDDSKITEKNLSTKEREALRRIALQNQARDKSVIEYADYRTDANNRNQYVDVSPSASNIDVVGKTATSPEYALKTALGQASITTDDEGNTIIRDRYNFNDAKDNFEFDEFMSDVVKAGLSGYAQARNLARYFGSGQGEGAEVEINLGKLNPEEFGTVAMLTQGRTRSAKGGKVDKKKMKCNKPKRTPNHPKKSHVVKACKDGKEKIIRFGQQGAKTAGKPKAGESKRMKAKRKSFKARHRKNIKRGNMSAAYWADKVKW